MKPEEELEPTDEVLSNVSSDEDVPPLPQGQPLSREESVERMYRRYAKTFEALAK